MGSTFLCRPDRIRQAQETGGIIYLVGNRRNFIRSTKYGAIYINSCDCLIDPIENELFLYGTVEFLRSTIKRYKLPIKHVIFKNDKYYGHEDVCILDRHKIQDLSYKPT